MRVLHVIGSISRSGGGPSRSSQGLVAGLRAVGVDAWLMTLNHGEEPWIKGCEKFINGGSFEEALEKVKPDIVHLHGIWQTGLHRCAVVCRKRGIPYVIAPRGMLEPWSLKQKWLKKRVARWLYQDRDLKEAAALHATAESEAEQFRSLGFKNPVIVSPNGVNLPEGALGVGDRCRCTADGRRAMAEKKVEEWLAGVDEATFEAALAKLVEEKTAAGEYRFANADERTKAIGWAKQFYLEFSHKLIELSDGRYVYFVPDVRARDRGVDNSRAWAEYAFHAVSTGGSRVSGKAYFVRHISEVKCENISRVEETIRRENCIAAVEEGRPERAAIHFVGISTRSKRFDIVTRLDEFGNAEANLSEVTVVMTKKKYSEKDPPPKFRPLTEVVEAVVKHQAAGFSPSTTERSIANRRDVDKGGNVTPQFVSLTEAIRTVVSHQTATGTYPPNESSIAFSTDENKGGGKSGCEQIV